MTMTAYYKGKPYIHLFVGCELRNYVWGKNAVEFDITGQGHFAVPNGESTCIADCTITAPPAPVARAEER